MKVKVKGLVFVGFAAMIFAANAMAADNTVTSKSYVDNKFQTIENIQTEFTETNKNSTTQYPSMSAVQAALDNIPGAEAYTGTGLIDVTGHTISTTAEANVLEGVQVAGVDQTITGKKVNLGAAAGKDVDATITAGSTSTDVPTSQAVAAFVEGQPGATAYTGTGLITVNDHTISTTAEANVLESVSVDGTPLTITNKGVDLGQAAAKDVDGTIAAGSTSTNVPTSQAVAAFVEGQPGATAYTGTGLITVNDHTISTTAEANVLEGVQVAGVDQTITGKKVNLGAAAGAGLASGITSSETGLTSGQQVYNYIDSLPAADIPAMPNSCSAAAPCVLTNDTTTGALTWVPIQQAE